MDQGRHFLFIPGPTNVPDRVLRALSRPMEDHRCASFPEFSKPLLEDMKQLFKTEDGQVFILRSLPGIGCSRLDSGRSAISGSTCVSAWA